MIRNVMLAVVAAVLTFTTAHGGDFPSIHNSEADEEARPMSAEEAAAGFEVPDGFRVGVFAREPDVQNPIAMTWDSRGRLWIAENFTYAEPSQRFDLSLRDRVLVFEDADGDGVAEGRTVFTDQVQMLTSVEVGHGGVWLMCPPNLLFIADADRDAVPDGPVKVVLDGFEVATENYHNFANGLKWGPDGWLYGRCGGSCPGRIGVPGTPDTQRVSLEGGIWRYHPRTTHFEVLAHGTTNPWGHDWNEFGDGFFINTVNGHLWHLIPGAHLERPFTLDPNPHVYELIDTHADHWHFDTQGDWTQSRHGAANSYGGGHAHSGMTIYLGDNWPAEYRGRLLTFNLHGRRVNQDLLGRHGSGYVGEHGPDTLLAADPFFRGIDLTYGPDGAVYAIDWSDTGECHEHTGVHRTSGRIFRVAHRERGGSTPHSLSDRATATSKSRHHERSVKRKAVASYRAPRRDLHSRSSSQLVELIKHRNEWFVRQARLILAERSHAAATFRDTDDLAKATESLKQIVRDSDAIEAYRALVTLHAMGAADSAFLRKQLSHPEEHLRAWAIRLLTDHWPIDDVFGPLSLPKEQAENIDGECEVLLGQLCEIAAGDESGLVRLTLASTLQRMPVSRRAQLAGRLMAREEDAEDHNLPLLVWYGLLPVAKASPMTLAGLAARSQWPKTQRFMARRLADQMDDRPAAVEMLLSHITKTEDAAVRRNLLTGISAGLKGWSRAPQPKNWHRVVAAMATDPEQTTQALVRDLSVLFGDGRALEEVRQLVLDEEANVGVRRTALQTLVSNGGDGVLDICLPLLGDARLNAVAAQGLVRSSDPKVAEALIKNYRRFRAPRRPQVIEILVSRATFAIELLNAVEAKKIPARDLTAFDVRQIRSLKDARLQDRVSAVWGQVRESSQAKREQIHSLKRQLNQTSIAAADPARGRILFHQSCAQCHRLFGQGESIGPDLTGANRTNLDYLLENIVDPSAVLSKDFHMTVVVTVDGRVLNGLVASTTEKTLTLQTQTDRKTIHLDDVEEMRRTPQSPMPDGLLDNLSQDQIQDLIAYLMHPTQVALPEGTQGKWDNPDENPPPPSR